MPNDSGKYRQHRDSPAAMRDEPGEGHAEGAQAVDHAAGGHAGQRGDHRPDRQHQAHSSAGIERRAREPGRTARPRSVAIITVVDQQAHGEACR